MSRLMKAMSVLTLTLLVVTAAGNTWLTRVHVDQLREARLNASLAIQNTVAVNNAQQYAAQRDAHAFTFAQAAMRERQIGQMVQQQYETAFARARIYVELCHAKLDEAKVAYPTQDEVEAEINNRTIKAALEQLMQQNTTNPECPEDGQPTPAPKEEPTPAPKEEPAPQQRYQAPVRTNKNNVE